MYLVQLIYASQKTDKFNNEAIEDILEVARTNNRRDHITGILCFSRKYFLQCLEGSRSKVNARYQKILTDPRHEKAVILSCSEITARDFNGWDMAYLAESTMTEAMILHHSGSPDFNPFEMGASSARAMLINLKQQL